jgi:hypothetical protein
VAFIGHGDAFSPISITPVDNIPSLTPVVHLDLRISSWLQKKSKNSLIGLSGGSKKYCDLPNLEYLKSQWCASFKEKVAEEHLIVQ